MLFLSCEDSCRTWGPLAQSLKAQGRSKSLRLCPVGTGAGSRVRKRRNQKGNKGRPAAAAYFFEERGEKMPTKSNNTGGRGGARPGAGRKKSAVREKAENGNPGGRRLEVLDIPEVEGVDMPKPHEFLYAEQRDGSTLQAEEIYTETWEWLKKVGCAAKVSPQLLERYAMCSARWIQCEEMTNRMGFLSKHPTTQKPIPSPFINIGINYMNQAVRLWNEIFQIVKENCSTDYGEISPQDDLMERLLRARKG